MPVNPVFRLAGLLGLAPALALAQVPSVDTSALAYFASHHQTVRADAELRRLRSLYPAWQPPADLSSLTIPDGAADKPLWDLFGADRLDDLDAAVAQRRITDPSWVPPADLVAKLAVKRARLDLIVASEHGDDAAVIAAAERQPDLVTPADLDVAWRVAASYGRTGRSDLALALDSRILDAVAEPAARLATVRKALPTLAPADLDALLAKGRAGPDGRPEFEAVGLDLARLRVGRVLAGAADKDADPADVTRLEAAARAPSGAPDAALLGWLASRRDRWDAAADWFGRALATVPSPAQGSPADAKVVEGDVLALQAMGRLGEAETLAYAWRDRNPALAVAYVDGMVRELTRPKPAPVAADRLARFGDAVSAQQSGDGAQALGWYAYNLRQPPAALAWFRKAFGWQPRDTTALGLALSLQRVGDKAEFRAFVADNRATFPTLVALLKRHDPAGAATAIRLKVVAARTRVLRPVRAVASGSSLPCSAATIATGGGGNPAAALRAGWCLMRLDRPKEAALAFASARGGDATARADAAYGQALAELRRHQADPAVEAADTGDLTPVRRNEIGVAALAQSAIDAFDAGRYDEAVRALDRRRGFAAEPRDLAVMRAWSEYHLGRKDAARGLFAALDGQLSTAETRSGLAASSLPTSRN